MSTKLATLSPELVSSLQKVLNGRNKKLTIVSSYTLAEEELIEIRKQLGLTDPEILVENQVDPTILGGLVVKYLDQFYDFSLRGKLTELAENLNL